MEKLSKLEIDLSGNFTHNGMPIKAIPVGCPTLIWNINLRDNLEFDEEGALKEVGRLVPLAADSYIVGTTVFPGRGKFSYRAVQYYQMQIKS